MRLWEAIGRPCPDDATWRDLLWGPALALLLVLGIVLFAGSGT